MTITDSTSGWHEGVSFPGESSRFVSKLIFYDADTITRARIVFPASKIPEGCEASLSADDGVNFESVSWNEWHTFTTQGTKLKYMLTGVTGSSLSIENSYGRSTPLKVEYTLRT